MIPLFASQVIAVTELDDSVWNVDNTRQTEMAVVATGAAEHDDTRLVRIVEPTLSPEEVPASWSTELPLEVPASGPMPGGGIPGIGPAEVEEFLAEIRG